MDPDGPCGISEPILMLQRVPRAAGLRDAAGFVAYRRGQVIHAEFHVGLI